MVTKNNIDEMKLRFLMMFSFRADDRNHSFIRFHYVKDRSIGSPMKRAHRLSPASRMSATKSSFAARIAFALVIGTCTTATLACVSARRDGSVSMTSAEGGTSAPTASASARPVGSTDVDVAPPSATDGGSDAQLAAIAYEPGHADLDPDNDRVVGPPAPVPDCAARLEAAGVSFRPASLPVKIMDRGAWSCGAEQIVEYRGSASAIRYNVPPLLTCTMALGIVRFERILQEEAAALFQSKVARIQHGGTYNCRRMARFDMVSEHSFANAIDLSRLTLVNGVTIDVVRHFGSRDHEPTSRESHFLRRVARRAYDENLFSVVLTPLFDPLHRDHFHLDMARYRVDGAR
jgi:hypothetical protein